MSLLLQGTSRLVAVLLRHSRSVSLASSSSVVQEAVDTVCLIGINRPHKRNAIDYETSNLLLEAFERFEQDQSLRVAVLYGKGGNFCSGYDLKELAENSDVIQKVKEDYRMKKLRPLV